MRGGRAAPPAPSLGSHSPRAAPAAVDQPLVEQEELVAGAVRARPIGEPPWIGIGGVLGGGHIGARLDLFHN